MSCVNTSLPEYKALAKKFDPFELQLAVMQYQKDNNTFDFPNEDFLKQTIGYTDSYIKKRESMIDDFTSVELAKELSDRLNIIYEVITEDELKKNHPDVPSNVTAFWEGSTGKVILIKGKFNASTILHEFTHPLIEHIYQNNPTLYTYLKSQLKDANGNRLTYLQVKQYLATKGYNTAQMMMEDIYKEAMVNMIQEESNALTKGLLTQPSTLFEKFWNAIKKILETLSPYIKTANINDIQKMSFNELAQYVLTSDGIDLAETRAKSKFYTLNEKISEEHNSAYIYQTARLGSNITEAQKDTAKKAMLNSAKFEANENNYVYTETGKVLERSSQFKKKLKGPQDQADYFTFGEEETDYWESRELGNQEDNLVEALIMGYSFEEAYTYVKEKQTKRAEKNTDPDIEIMNVNISKELLQTTYDETENTIETELADYILLPQVIVGSNKLGFAGTADIFAIAPDGRIKILDVKTGKYIAYKEDGNPTTDYGRPFANNTRASRIQGHTAQLSLYKGAAKENGFVFEDSDELGLLNIHLERDPLDDYKVISVKPEGLHFVDAYDYLVEMFKEGPSKEYSQEQKNVLDKIRASVLERIELLKRNPNVKAKKLRELELQRLYEVITTVEKSKALFSFIQDAYNNLVFKEVPGRSQPVAGVTDRINYINGQYKSGKLTAEEALESLYYFKTLAELYRPIVSELKNLFTKEMGLSYQDTVNNQMFSMINEVIAATASIQVDYQKNAIPIIADILFEQVDPQLNEKLSGIMERYGEKLKKIIDTKGIDSRDYEKAKKEYDYYLKAFRTESGITKDYITKILQIGSEEDVSWVDSRLSPAISSSNELISLSAKLVKQRFENARQESIEVVQGAEQAFTSFTKSNPNTNNVAEFNEAFYETVEMYNGLDENGKATYRKEKHFVSELDQNAYQKAIGQREERIASAKTEQEKRIIRREFIKANNVLRPRKDITVLNPYRPDDPPVVLVKGLDTLLAEQKELLDNGTILQYEYDNFVKRMEGDNEGGEYYYDSKFTMPNSARFSNAKYGKMKLQEKLYYNFMIATYFKSQERTPSLYKTYRLPSVVKSNFDRVFQNGAVDYLKYVRDNMFSELAEDIDRYGAYKKESGFKVIPVLYANEMNADDVSLDLLSSVLKYDSASLIYSAQTETQPFAESLLEIVKQNSPKATDSLGRKVLNKFAEKIPNVAEGLKFTNKSDNDNNVFFLLNAFFDTQVYGIRKIPFTVNIMGNAVKIDKVVDMVKGFASKTQIGGLNVLGGIANSLQANVSTAIEAAAKQFISDKSMVWAKKEYYSLLPDYMRDLNAGTATSRIGQLIELYDPMQGNYKDAYGRRITKTTFKKLMSSNSWYFLHKAGEHAIHIQAFMAYLKDTKVMQNGKEISLYDAYELDSAGKIKLLEGVTLPGKTSSNGKISLMVQNRLHAMDKRINGVYNEFDAPELKRHWYGSLLFMYRDFLVPGFKKRYKTLSVDQEFSSPTEGYWNTFMRKLIKDKKQLMRFYLGLEKESADFQDFERENLRRSIRELAIVFATGLLVMVLKNLYKAADDDEKEKWKYMLYLTMKLNQELGAYGTVGDPQNWFRPNFRELARNFKQPFVIFGTVDKLFKIFDSIGQTYERDTGMFEKGDSKFLAALIKFFGITGVNFDPEEAIKYMNMSSK
jgi:hypothetical protein